MNNVLNFGSNFTLKEGFQRDVRRISVSHIIPLRVLKPQILTSAKFQQIRISIQEMGLVEPPVVKAAGRGDQRYYLIDGHLRIACLHELGIVEVDCLITDEDDTYTYNKRVNKLAAVQDHRMIVKAIERGVSPERLAKSLGLTVDTVKLRFRLLNRICPEAVSILADVPCPSRSFNLLRQMTPLRQIESAELMVAQKNCSVPFVRALLAATPTDQLSERAKKPVKRSSSASSMSRLEREIASLQMQIAKVEDTYGPDVLHLTVVRGYLTRLLGNAVMVNWLAAHNPEFLREFQRISAMDDLSATAAQSYAETAV